MTISINATTNAAVTTAICKLDPEKKKKEVKTSPWLYLFQLIALRMMGSLSET